MDSKNIIGEKIRFLMKKKGITYEKLAEMTGRARSTIQTAITDPKSRTLEVMEDISRALGVSLLWLLEPAPPWPDLYIYNEEEEAKRLKKKIYLKLSEPVLDVITRRANEIGISRSAYVNSILEQAIRLYRVLCPNCEGVFWVEQERGWKCCPYCGAKEEEMIDEPIVE